MFIDVTGPCTSAQLNVANIRFGAYLRDSAIFDRVIRIEVRLN